mmetsp:Transcript_66495/g.191136  ORF Transcript_66495/g.191136 Transcript_66495/m.191136 type:complete len:255 (-) Transcript_66495:629-1393(-)
MPSSARRRADCPHLRPRVEQLHREFWRLPDVKRQRHLPSLRDQPLQSERVSMPVRTSGRVPDQQALVEHGAPPKALQVHYVQIWRERPVDHSLGVVQRERGKCAEANGQRQLVGEEGQGRFHILLADATLSGAPAQQLKQLLDVVRAHQEDQSSLVRPTEFIQEHLLPNLPYAGGFWIHIVAAREYLVGDVDPLGHKTPCKLQLMMLQAQEHYAAIDPREASLRAADLGGVVCPRHAELGAVGSERDIPRRSDM